MNTNTHALVKFIQKNVSKIVPLSDFKTKLDCEKLDRRLKHQVRFPGGDYEQAIVFLVAGMLINYFTRKKL